MNKCFDEKWKTINFLLIPNIVIDPSTLKKRLHDEHDIAPHKQNLKTCACEH